VDEDDQTEAGHRWVKPTIELSKALRACVIPLVVVGDPRAHLRTDRIRRWRELDAGRGGGELRGLPSSPSSTLRLRSPSTRFNTELQPHPDRVVSRSRPQRERIGHGTAHLSLIEAPAGARACVARAAGRALGPHPDARPGQTQTPRW
jgi:hypothetical protein